MAEILFKELSFSIVGAAMEVHRQLGSGFLENVYQLALAHEFGLRHIPFEQQVPLLLSYKEARVGKYRADFIVDEKIILEIKGASVLVPAHEAQAYHYLGATGLRLALLMNFGAQKLQVKRFVR